MNGAETQPGGTAVGEDKLEQLIDACVRNGGKYECLDEASFRLILQKGGKFGALVNVPYQEKGFKTQCTLTKDEQFLTFCIFAPQTIDW